MSTYSWRSKRKADRGYPANTRRLYSLNPLSPHDALMHHFTSLKIELIFLQPRVLEFS